MLHRPFEAIAMGFFPLDKTEGLLCSGHKTRFVAVQKLLCLQGVYAIDIAEAQFLE